MDLLTLRRVRLRGESDNSALSEKLSRKSHLNINEKSQKGRSVHYKGRRGPCSSLLLRRDWPVLTEPRKDLR